MSNAVLRKGIAAAAALTVVGFALLSPAASAAPNQPKSNGHGSYTSTDDDGNEYTRQFSFNAVTAKDGSVSGHAVIHNPAYDFTAMIDIQCMVVTGNQAYFGGVVTKSNDPSFTDDEGFDRAFFSVVDKGEPGSADTISPVYFDDTVGPESCALIGPSDFVQVPIEGGNVQVK